MVRAMAVVFGLVAALVLSACGPGASRGTMPPGNAIGEVVASKVPDFIAYVGRTDRIIGWVPKSYLLEPEQHCPVPRRVPECDPIPVYADDLTTLIGHDVPGRGFVPLGVEPAIVPERPVQVGPSFAPPATP